MISGNSLSQAVRPLALIVPLSVCFLAGCAEGPLDRYPPTVTYPARGDVLVLELPKSTPFYSYPPGKLDESVAQIDKEGGKTLDPKKIDAKSRAELTKKLRDVYGTPRNPKVVTSEETTSLKDDLGLTMSNLRKGSALYRRHCLHCHGVAGDGRGPTGPWVDPHPRDYRQGVFKFISTSNDLKYRKPRREDLVRTLHQGIEGTSMPSFGLLPENEINALVSYVIHLSMRGETEYTTLSLFKEGEPVFQHPSPDKDETLDLPGYVDAFTAELLKHWAIASETKPNKIDPPNAARNDPKTGTATTESIVRGYKKFIEPTGEAACLSCHADFGRQALYRFDQWGTLARPANLTVPIYRGGRRPLDLYYRVAGGIEGCGMPANKTLSTDQFWDLVNFVQALPYPRMLPNEKVDPGKILDKTLKPDDFIIRDRIYVPHKTHELKVAESRH